MEILKNDVKRLPRLFLGFIVLALGIQLTRLSGLGMSSWSVLHEGIGFQTGYSFGLITQVLGFIIITFSVILIKTKIGLGTIFNALFVGFFIDGFALVIPKSTTEVSNIIYLLLGFVVMTFGRSLYISSNLGPGPRDGLFVGIARITKFDVKYVKPAIELVILLIGFLLGGTIGFGTVLITICSGYFVQFYFKILHFDPKQKYQNDVILYFLKESQI